MLFTLFIACVVNEWIVLSEHIEKYNLHIFIIVETHMTSNNIIEVPDYMNDGGYPP